MSIFKNVKLLMLPAKLISVSRINDELKIKFRHSVDFVAPLNVVNHAAVMIIADFQSNMYVAKFVK